MRTHSGSETFNTGNSLAPPVVDDYQVPSPFAGTINTVTAKLGPTQLTPAEMEAIGLESQLKQ